MGNGREIDSIINDSRPKNQTYKMYMECINPLMQLTEKEIMVMENFGLIPCLRSPYFHYNNRLINMKKWADKVTEINIIQSYDAGGFYKYSLDFVGINEKLHFINHNKNSIDFETAIIKELLEKLFIIYKEIV